MNISFENREKILRLKEAFLKDNFLVEDKDIVEFEGQIGILAKHKEAVNSVTLEPKKAFYVEGNNYQMGYLLGLLAEKEISRMSEEFVKKIIPAFINISHSDGEKIINIIEELLVKIVYEFSKSIEPDIPSGYKEELRGLVDGCKKVNNETKVNLNNLWVLNVGIDCLLAYIYTGRILNFEKSLSPQMFKIPIMCNAFSVFGDACKDNKHYFGRDFMFPTAGVFQDVACLVIYNPASGNPIISQTAPGMIGSIAAMNDKGVSIGVDMNPSQFCNPERPGFNSLLLARHCMHYANSAKEVVDLMIKVPRGVSWFYIVADGTTDRACVIEAGCETGSEPFPYFKYLPRRYREIIPDEKYIEEKRKKYNTPGPVNGLVVRWNDYVYPENYIKDFNEKLWNFYNKHKELELYRLDSLTNIPIPVYADELFRKADYDPRYFGKMGYINKNFKEKNCPSAFYFTPQREDRDDVIICSNHCITPEMRLLAMNDWLALIVGEMWDDIQWRYDELNYQIMTAIESGGIDKEKAIELIDYLAPYNKFPGYYNPDGKDYRTIPISGSVSLFDLKEKTVVSHFGYYGDKWVELDFKNYISNR